MTERCLDADPLLRPHSALELAHALEGLGGLSEPMELAPRTRRKAEVYPGSWRSASNSGLSSMGATWIHPRSTVMCKACTASSRRPAEA